ncbi:MAG: ABC transporter ATP-binding protein [Aliivibrio sp.]|uniref:ABC transporter ATP-binding protein n=1 Tax=Aliivibrio sp. TaxID=1872443 RepID=UPI001A3C6BEA|nr:ABC transporter ATP-binding protein [Aliivibrio sp.]
MSELIRVSNVSKSYGQFQALHNVSFDIKAGQVLGLLGHNGAGKSSLITAMLGGHSYEGSINILGCEPRKEREKMMRELSYISDVSVLPGWMKVSALIRYMSGVHSSFNKEAALERLSTTDIPLKAKVQSLSKGMKVQLHLALVMATDCKVLILDEPTLGLDLMYRERFYRELLEWFHDGERALVIASHEVSEIEHLLTDVIFLKQGNVVLQSDLESLNTKYVQLTAKGDNAVAASQLTPLSMKQGLGSVQMIFNSEKREVIEPLGELSSIRLAELFVALQMSETVASDEESAEGIA